MPPSLRKACQACTKSKRRCVPQLPACDRCVKKQIPCVYDLEPVVHSEPLPQSQNDALSNGSTPQSNGSQLNIVYSSVETARSVSIAALASGEKADSAAAKPKLMADGEYSTWLVAFFAQLARDGLEGKPSPFVHTRIVQGQLATSYDPSGVIRLGHDERTNLETKLSEIHTLLTQSLNRLLLDKPSCKNDPELETLLTRMFTSTRSLWEAAPPNLDTIYSPWQSWLIAESIRRAMFAAILIRGIWYVAAAGYVHYEPFFESMPFDPRGGLWEAESAEKWEELVTRRGGQHTKLKSYHEFITSAGTKLNPEEDGAFQRMLFVCYHGANGIRALEEFDSRANR